MLTVAEAAKTYIADQKASRDRNDIRPETLWNK
jgi:hypothetical protein